MSDRLAIRHLDSIVSTLHVTIPDEPDAIDALAGDLVTLTTGGQWAVAALVSARTQSSGPGRPRKGATLHLLPYKAFAARGIRGLTDWRTVKFYAETWESDGRGKPQPGDVVSLPDESFPLRIAKPDDGPLVDPDAPRHRPDVDGFVLGDFRTVAPTLPPDSVDLIFTDPPYDRKSLPLYGDLATVAARILAPGGSLVCYIGQYQLPEVLDLVTPHLRFWWPLALVHEGGPFARLNQLGVIVRWKPLLWFVKGTRAGVPGYMEDVIFSPPSGKGHHQWQQEITEASYLIDHLTPADGYVFDPFCGAGTTAIAARDLGRRFLTCDIDEDALNVAKARALG